MMDVKEAVRKAALELANVMIVPAETVLLEEVERIREDGSTYWKVTLSYPARKGIFSDIGSLGAAFGAKVAREYKTLQIDADNGELKAIKMKTLAE